ncbi:TPA: M15 family metallopeptidase [Stenotrophomonas maltophilia]|nr:M15 family metallopeptidase [Stenotrophomonas sp. B2]MBH1592086.1 M15 family metallopeptidase [Stenotrophomonas maltophilia]MBH1663923.1 M15 family metallopeptidase [Stenotrophomonas maltophilia]MBH1837539.1 M15 family metallopeptidase [Stenotrophomonas maltophilia]MCU1020393.1 M15 family metallopeptidase [Stenotrophomonas maltophilia]
MPIVVAAIAVVLLVAGVCWVLLFPETVESLRQAIAKRLGGFRRRAGQVGDRVGHGATRVRSGVREEVGAVHGALRRHWLILVVAAALLLIPPIVIFVTRQTVVLEDFRGDDLAESSSMVAQLLRGERLTPPPPPPPEVFTTAEVRRLRPEIVTADRKWGQIDPDLQQRVLAIYEVMRRQYGYEMVLIEGYRSPQRQAELMAGGKATRAGAWQSCHQYGLGVDSAPIRDGKLQWDMEDPWTRRGYFLYGELAEQAGLDWGGNWRSIKDYVHVEMTDRCRAARVAKREELSRQG